MLSRAHDQRLEVELVGDTAVVLLRPEQGPPAAVLKVARGPREPWNWAPSGAWSPNSPSITATNLLDMEIL